MSKFYTRVGDSGYSNMLGKVVKKSSSIVEAIGNVDELNSFIGAAIANVDDDRIASILKGVQENLFIIGAELSSIINKRFSPKETISEEKVTELEKIIADLSLRLPDLNKFVLPGGSESASSLHLSRAVSRRAERSVIRIGNRVTNRNLVSYLNRLSSLLFVAALYMNKKEGIDEANPHY
jgi:cob(I)alamin adenosyltransferase